MVGYADVDSVTTRTIIDCAGDEVTIPATVESVINLVAYGCQGMVGLGLGNYLAGISDETIESQWIIQMYPRIAEITQYSGESSAELLLRANADIVIVENAESARELRSKGVTALTFTYYTIDEVKASYLMLGEVFGGKSEEKCKMYVTYLDSCIHSIADALNGKLDKKETLYYINGVSNKGLYKTTGHGSTNWAEAELAYTIFATADLIEAPANKVDSEAILAVDPENIIIGGKYQHVLYDTLISSPEWSNNSAVREGHIFKVPMGISAWNRYGIEIALMIPWTAATVYPEFYDFDVAEETRKFYLAFTGYELTDQEVQYILQGLTPDGEIEIAN